MSDGKMVLRERIELSTSSLPMRCSTTELPQRGVGGRCRRRTERGISRSNSAWQRSLAEQNARTVLETAGVTIC